MDYTHIPHISTFEGDKDQRHHWFICETIWDSANINDESKKITQFVRSLRKKPSLGT